MQLVVPTPVNELFPQDKAVTVGETLDPAPIDVVPFSVMDVVFEAESYVAVSVTVCADAMDATFAAKFALVAPEGMVTAAGTLIELLLLARLTVIPALVAAVLMVTVQLSVPAALIEVFAQLSPAIDSEVCL